MFVETAHTLIARIDEVEADLRRLEVRLTGIREAIAKACGVDADPRVNAERQQKRAAAEDAGRRGIRW